MSAPDMEVIKEIPGYKVILKAVLKSQIQQLVETLATHTDEESVILTASVSDGTLSHLGSDSGKFFLEDHEDVKSQFLGFCLKRHHRQKQSEKEKEAAEAALRSPPVVPTQMGLGPGFVPRMPSFSSRAPRMNLPRHTSPRHSMPSHGGYTPPMRHEPYPVSRPQKRNSIDTHEQGPAATSQMMLPISSAVKVEPADNENNSGLVPSSSLASNDNGDSLSQDGTTRHKPGIVRSTSDGNEESTQDSNFSSDATLPNTPNPNNETAGNSETDIDPNVSVKVESITEGEMELEITGVEPGRSISTAQENWVPDPKTGMVFDSSGALGNQSDMPGGSQDYSKPTTLEDPFQGYPTFESETEGSESNFASEAMAGESGQKRFRRVDYDELTQFMDPESHNLHTQRKTKSDMDVFFAFLDNKKDGRDVIDIPVEELNEYVTEFFLSVTKKNGDEYEPCTLRGFMSSIDRYLKIHGYRYSIVASPEFRKTRATLKGKQKQLKALGKGNKPKAANPIDDDIIEKFYECGTLGDSNPVALIHSLWMICTLHFGLKSGHLAYNLRWGDIQLREDERGEHLVYDKDDSIRKPRVYAGGEKNKDPVHLYKLYASKRPDSTLDLTSPFFLSIAQKPSHSRQNFDWYKPTPMGINKIHNIMNSMKADAGIEDSKITPISVRKHLARKLTAQMALNLNLSEAEHFVQEDQNSGPSNNFQMSSDDSSLTSMCGFNPQIFISGALVLPIRPLSPDEPLLLPLPPPIKPQQPPPKQEREQELNQEPKQEPKQETVRPQHLRQRPPTRLYYNDDDDEFESPSELSESSSERSESPVRKKRGKPKKTEKTETWQAEKFNCSVCLKNFQTRWRLATHWRVHSGEKPFECQICQKRFNTKGNLKAHMNTHVRKMI